MHAVQITDLSDEQKARFWSKITITDGCWLWNAGTNQRYGTVWFRRNGQRRGFVAHVVAYELLRGPVPAGLELDHTCRNTLCVNPDHLEPVTHLENVRRGTAGQHLRDRSHCPQGHAYDEENTRYTRTGSRMCRTCERSRALSYYHAKRATGWNRKTNYG